MSRRLLGDGLSARKRIQKPMNVLGARDRGLAIPHLGAVLSPLYAAREGE